MICLKSREKKTNLFNRHGELGFFFFFGCSQQLQLYEHKIYNRKATAVHPNIASYWIPSRKFSLIIKIKV